MARMMLNTDGNIQPAAVEPVQEAFEQEPAVMERRRSRTEPAPAPAPAAQEEDRYAHMFAEWDLLPPQVLIRRITRKV